MDKPNYWRGFFSGTIATYVMTVSAYWVSSIGLPPTDPSRLMAYSFGQAPYLFGLAAHFMNGIVIGLIYARWRSFVPGHSIWMKDIVIGVLMTLAAQLIVGPTVGPKGFFWQQAQPLGVLATSTIAHLVFGLSLVASYEE
jgi:uncharacterized membrane protein YagU involved in acid resistance